MTISAARATASAVRADSPRSLRAERLARTPRLRVLSRQWHLIALLRAYGGITLDRMATETGVTTRTVRRDLEALEALYMPIETTVLDDGVTRWRFIKRAPCPCCGHAPAETATERLRNAALVSARQQEPA